MVRRPVRHTERRRASGDTSWVVPVPVRVLMVLLTVGVAVYSVSLLPVFRTGDADIPWLDLWLKNALWPFFGIIALWRVVQVRTERVAWTFLAASLIAGGTGCFAYYGFLRFETVPFPSVADAGWLLTYPLAYVGVVLLLKARVGRLNPAMWLDAFLAAFAGGAVAGLALIGRLLKLTSAELLPALAGLAYPLSDLLLLMVVASVFGLFRWRPGRAWGLLGLGFAGMAVSDSGYALMVSNETWHANTLLDAGWPIAYLLIAVAAWQRPRRHVPQPVGLADLVAPAVFALMSVVVLFVATLTDVPLVVSLLALAGVLTTIARTAITFRQVRDVAVFHTQARTDDLTGLPNRRRFSEALAAALTRPDAEVSVLLIDLNRFKEVNDSLGHAAGDELLVEVGHRFASALRTGDLLARFGGDEFAVLAPGSDAEGAQTLAARLSATLVDPFVLSGVRVHVGASIGVAAGPDTTDTTNATELIRRADVAMYRAKADRCDAHEYADALDEPSRDRLRLVEDLRTGIEERQLVLHYQPKIAVSSGRVTGVEALVRWQHPERGLLFPDTFLPLAEDAGLSAALTGEVLRTALEDCAAWRADGLTTSVAVNLSASELLDRRLPDRVAALLDHVDLPATALVLEVTESVFMVDRETSVSVLEALRDLGIRISMDDYGTGYSSLAYLRELPIDELKLDRSFIGNLDADPRAAAIVESTIALSHSLGLAMVAEGVETRDALTRLRTYGCDLAQGYHVSRPLPQDTLRAWFAGLDAAGCWGTSGHVTPTTVEAGRLG